jgi:hypothetical protein
MMDEYFPTPSDQNRYDLAYSFSGSNLHSGWVETKQHEKIRYIDMRLNHIEGRLDEMEKQLETVQSPQVATGLNTNWSRSGSYGDDLVGGDYEVTATEESVQRYVIDEINKKILAPLLSGVAIISSIIVLGAILEAEWILATVLLPIPASIFYSLWGAYKNDKFE